MFKKGQSGNPHGRPRISNSLATLCRQKLSETATEEVFTELKKKYPKLKNRTKITNLEAIIYSLIANAQDGNPKSVKEVLDRSYGQAVSQLELSAPDGEDLKIDVNFNVITKK